VIGLVLRGGNAQIVPGGRTRKGDSPFRPGRLMCGEMAAAFRLITLLRPCPGHRPAAPRAGGEPVRAGRGGGACRPAARQCASAPGGRGQSAHGAGHRRRPRVPITPGLSARSTNSGISPRWCASRWMGGKRRPSRRSPFLRGSNGSRSVDPGPTYSFGTPRSLRLPGARSCRTNSGPAARRHPGPAGRDRRRDRPLARDRPRRGGGLGPEHHRTSRRRHAGRADIAITPGPVVSFGQLIPRGQSGCVSSVSWKSPVCPRV
jgi:hypothetical protein